MISRLSSRFRGLLPILVWLYIPTGLILLLTIFTSWVTGYNLAELVRDVAATTRSSPVLGMLSNTGIIVWSATSAICFFSFTLLPKTSYKRSLSYFLLFAGLLTSVLLLDDLFLLHEHIIPSALNLPLKIVEQIILVGYAIAIVTYFLKFRRLIFTTDFILLLLSIAFFAMSLALDFAPIELNFIPIKPWIVSIFLEDCCKFLGIVTWFGYWARTCWQAISPASHLSYAKPRDFVA